MSRQGFSGFKSAIPSEKDIKLARQLSRALLKGSAKKARSIDIVLKENKKQTDTIVLPPTAYKLLVVALSQMAEGNAVTILPSHAELTTQQAADLLQVSRPFLIKLLNSKQIPFHKVGTRRKILLRDLLSYKAAAEETRRKVFAALTQEAQELGLY